MMPLFLFMILPILILIIFALYKLCAKINNKTNNLKLDTVFTMIKTYLYFFSIFYIAADYLSSVISSVDCSNEFTLRSLKHSGELVILLGGIASVEFIHNMILSISDFKPSKE